MPIPTERAALLHEMRQAQVPVSIRRAVSRVAARRHGAPILGYGELAAFAETTGTSNYYWILDSLVSMGAGETRQQVEDALQGITPCVAEYAVCACHGVERLARPPLGVWAGIASEITRHPRRVAGHQVVEPVHLCNHTGYASLHHEYGLMGYMSLAGREALARLFFSVPDVPNAPCVTLDIQEDYARCEYMPTGYGEALALDVYRIVSETLDTRRIDSLTRGERFTKDSEATPALMKRLRAEYARAPWTYPNLHA